MWNEIPLDDTIVVTVFGMHRWNSDRIYTLGYEEAEHGGVGQAFRG